MALPLLLAAATIIGRTAAVKLLKKGGEAALKKIINNAKGVKRLSKKANDGQKKTEGMAQYSRTAMKSKAKALVAGGTAVGAAGAMSKDEEKPKTRETTKPKDGRINAADFPTYKKGTKSASAFRKAFAEAKKDGKKTFKFEGRSYKVETK
jgi:hypothetical protein